MPKVRLNCGAVGVRVTLYGVFPSKEKTLLPSSRAPDVERLASKELPLTVMARQPFRTSPQLTTGMAKIGTEGQVFASSLIDCPGIGAGERVESEMPRPTWGSGKYLHEYSPSVPQPTASQT